jgi:hypothetical protein
MSMFFSSGHAVDLIIGVLVLEAITLVVMRGPKLLANVASTIAPGVCLLLALRVSMTGGRWQWIAFWLIISFPAHIMDLWRRPL